MKNGRNGTSVMRTGSLLMAGIGTVLGLGACATTAPAAQVSDVVRFEIPELPTDPQEIVAEIHRSDLALVETAGLEQARVRLRLSWLLASPHRPRPDYQRARDELEIFFRLVGDHPVPAVLQQRLGLLQSLTLAADTERRLREQLQSMETANDDVTRRTWELTEKLATIGGQQRRCAEELEQQRQRIARQEEQLAELQSRNEELTSDLSRLKELDLKLEQKRAGSK